jgi:hypothetical protein
MLVAMAPSFETDADFVARLLAGSPSLARAVAEVDQTLLDHCLSLTPDERLQQLRRMGKLWEVGLDAARQVCPDIDSA